MAEADSKKKVKVPSAKKRVKIARKRTLRNKMVKTNLKTVLKSTLLTLEQKRDGAKEAVQFAIKKLDKAAAKGVIHKNKAANKKSQLQIKYNKMLKGAV